MIINMNGAKAPETPSSVLQEKTITPETLPTVIGPDEGYDGLTQVTVNPDAQLIPTNIRSGKTVFGVEGSFVGEPTAGLNYDDIGRLALSCGFEYPLFISNAVDIEPATRLTELNVPSTFSFNNIEHVFINYGTGGLVSGRNMNDPSISKSSYVPSVSNYFWYHKQGTISGEMTFYASYQGLTSSGLWTADNHPTHIKGYGYLTSGIEGISNSGNYDYDDTGHISKAYGDENLVRVDIDTDITFDRVIKFTLNVPPIEADVYSYNYSSLTNVGLGLCLLLKKAVIE